MKFYEALDCFTHRTKKADAEMCKKRIFTNTCMGLYIFINAVEYAIFIPTLNEYLASLGASQVYLGFALSAYSLSGLVAAPMFGHISDRTGRPMLVIIVGNGFEAVGNFMYFAGANTRMVLTSRLVAGFGSGAMSAVYGIISRTTTTKERTRSFTLFLVCRQAGNIIGPVFDMLLNSLDFHMGPFHVNRYTSQGLVITLMYLLHTILLLFAYKNSRDSQTLEVTEGDRVSPERRSPADKTSTTIKKILSISRQFFSEEVRVCLSIAFVFTFVEITMTTSLTPVTLLYFDWKSLQNSYLYISSSVIATLGFVLFNFLCRWLPDRALVLSGCVGIIASLIIYGSSSFAMWFRENPVAPFWLLPLFITATVFFMLILPFLLVPHTSLLSKVTDVDEQAFSHGVRIGVMGVAQVLSPLWGASMATLQRLPLMFGVNIFLVFMVLAMTILSYKHLVPHEIQCSPSNGKLSSSRGESLPFLSAQSKTPRHHSL